MPSTGDTIPYIDLYRAMFAARRSEERLLDLYKQSLVKGTVTTGTGNEGAISGVALALDPEVDVCNFMQRDFSGYLAWGVPVYHLFCHYLANKDSYTEGKDGNVHHGIPEKGMLPMISHLGAMLPNVVGAVHARRAQGMNSVGLAIIGDGGTSTGDFHESLNIASVLNVPVLFLIENNHWAYSTPNNLQFKCDKLSSRAAGYGIEGRSIRATNAVEVYQQVREIVSNMRDTGEPYLLETNTYRLLGHAAYDTADYVPTEELDVWKAEDPITVMRSLMLDAGVKSEEELISLEKEWEDSLVSQLNKAIAVEKVEPDQVDWSAYQAPGPRKTLPSGEYNDLTAVQAINAALDLSLAQDDDVFLIGEDIGSYEGPFKATKGLFESYGRSRVIDMPLAESGFTGFALGSAAMGRRPVIEMQFSDFSTDATTQIGVNAGTYRFRTGLPMPLTIRMPGGGGLSYGPFHSMDLEGMFGTFPGLKIVYPSVIDDFFTLCLASIYDDNPVLFFETKYLYRRVRGSFSFDGKVPALDDIKARITKEGSDVTIVAYGAMYHEAVSAAELADKQGVSVELIDPRVLKPFDWDTVVASVSKTHRLLVVHESWRSGSLGSDIVAGITERCFFDLEAPPLELAANDNPVPFAPELEERHRPNAQSILGKIQTLLEY